MSLTTKIREYRVRDKLSQEELAQKVGVRRETIGNLENGKYNPSLKLAMGHGHRQGVWMHRGGAVFLWGLMRACRPAGSCPAGRRLSFLERGISPPGRRNAPKNFSDYQNSLDKCRLL